MKKLVLSVFLIPVLAACTTYEQAHRELSAGTPHDLCYAATDGRIGVVNKKKAAIAIIQARGLQCDWVAYAQIHAAETSSSLQMMNMGTQMMKNARPPANSYGTTSPYHTYIIDGKMVNCSTVGTTTSCY